MEEIDNIIIDSLKNLHCDMEDVTSLKQFDTGLVLLSISTCLETILPGTSFPKKPPSSMSMKLKFASNLAQRIKDLGFRDDIGYQTILYSNEAEIRRVLMFLIERVPRESNKVVHIEDAGYVPCLVREIQKKVKENLDHFWLPSSVLNRGCRKIEGSYLVNNLGEASFNPPRKLKIPSHKSAQAEECKHFWIHNTPVVTKQCENVKDLVPSLLFNDAAIHFGDKLEFKYDDKLALSISNNTSQLSHLDSFNKSESIDESLELSKGNAARNEPEDILKSSISVVKERQTQYIALREALKNIKTRITQVDTLASGEEKALTDLRAKVDLKSKALTVLGKEENLQKLKKMIENSNNRLIDLSNQWNDVQNPLLEEYKALEDASSSSDAKLQEEMMKFKNLEDAKLTLSIDFQDKISLEEKLRRKLEQVNKSHGRAGYTKRILEIIGNIKKQDKEIEKILNDTREIQREINNLSGQVDRSFTLSDELIFRDAKQDETARKSYKLLVSLHDECSNIIKAVTDLGLVERECRNLQDQIDAESVKDTNSKLESVTKDLQAIKNESEQLTKNKS